MPMRSAADVIKRLQWDEGLQSKSYTVGYIDRFLGVVERPFAEFNWANFAETDPDDVSIPEHRIAYFRYKDCMLWNKDTRVDRIFKSGRADRDTQNMSVYELIEREDSKSAFVDSGAEEEEDQEEGEVVPDPEQDTFCFEALIEDEYICEQLSRIQENISSELEDAVVKTISREKLHVTLAVFQCPPSVSGAVCKAVQKETESINSLNISLESMTLLKGRVVAATVPQNDSITEVLVRMETALKDQEATRLTHDVLHVTLLRLQRQTNFDSRQRVREYIASIPLGCTFIPNRLQLRRWSKHYTDPVFVVRL